MQDQPAANRTPGTVRREAAVPLTHGIFTSTGNVVAWFDTEDEALASLRDLVAEEAEAGDEIAAIPFDSEGHACGPAIKGSTLLSQRSNVA